MILRAGVKLGFKPKIHADESRQRGARVAIRLELSSADHLVQSPISDLKDG